METLNPFISSPKAAGKKIKDPACLSFWQALGFSSKDIEMLNLGVD